MLPKNGWLVVYREGPGDREGSGDKSEVTRGSGLGLRLCLPVGTLDVAGLLEL